MVFNRRGRGRPKNPDKNKKDKGTKELQSKRALNITTEPLDLCLQKDLITSQQHVAGLRFRWLYTLQFGSLGVSAYSPDDLGGHSCRYNDEEWLAKRKIEYIKMIRELRYTGAKKIVMDVCIFGIHPSFLVTEWCLKRPNLLPYKELCLFRNGLDVLV